MFQRLILALLVGVISPALWAGEVLQVKGAKALLNVGEGEFHPGDEVFTISPDGKKKSILKIGSMKNGKAVGAVLKGTPEAGQTLQLRVKPAAAATAASPETPAAETAAASESTGKPPFGFMKKGKSAMGLMLGMAQNKLDITASNAVTSETISLAGSSYGLLGYIDLSAGKQFTWRGGFGYQSFKGTGTTKTPAFCNSSTNCSLEISYLTAEGWGQFNILQTRDKTRAWLGAGGEYMIAMSKSNSITALNVGESTNYFLYLSAGADIAMGTSYIPLSIDYGLQPSASAGAKAGLLILRLGYGWRY